MTRLISCRQANTVKDTLMLGNQGGIDKPARMRQVCDEHQAHCHCLAVAAGVVLPQLHRVAESMTVVQRLPQPGFLQVFTNDLGLNRYGARDQLWQESVWIQTRCVVLLSSEERRVAEQGR